MGKLIYTGIGSRQTPFEIQQLMADIAYELADKWILRSGHADGADKAFEAGARAAMGEMEIYLPWEGFNGAKKGSEYIVPFMASDLMGLAAQYHPAWNSCTPTARLLHARNGCQIFGQDLRKPANMVICWTPDGKASGGTGQALRIAEDYNIPIFNLFSIKQHEALVQFVLNQEKQYENNCAS